MKRNLLPLTKSSIIAVSTERVLSLSIDDIRRLCENGSFWINIDDATNGTIDVSSLLTLGRASDRANIEYARECGAILLIDFDGLADSFDVELPANDGETATSSFDESRVFSLESGRRELLSCVLAQADAALDRLGVELEEYAD